jgi:hypothetical protein
MAGNDAGPGIRGPASFRECARLPERPTDKPKVARAQAIQGVWDKMVVFFRREGYL